MKNWIVNNFWIKIVSLILAVVTWVYINGELTKERPPSRNFFRSIREEKPAKITSPFLEEKDINKGYVVEKE